MVGVTIAFLAVVGALAAGLLFVVSKKFYVEEDARIEQVNEILPGANCGGCGFPGCSGFARACVEAESMDRLFCTVGGNDVMLKVAEMLGRAAVQTDPKVAVVRCNGNCEDRPRVNQYDGASTCAIASSTYGGETGCTFGCFGLGDCTLACGFDAIHMNPATGLPEVDEEKCTACGACVKACPKMIIELRNKGPKGRRIFVSCVNKDKGAVARKACNNACIGCSKCEKECKFDAITIENNLAYIDHNKCRLCRKCVEVCPTGAIHEINFPPRKVKEEVIATVEA
ncbi:MAG: Fe-S cluster domain-containing protein [Bacteroidales bacterium]|uniref:Fe-S cluster domain-containing protein n=1 Tax=Porphyromonas sp. TaxID=1924944 RepID=UPI00297B67DC|nr:Fe-S cluster domain-containing protein [Porphyromonas sp.]MDD7437988.1 Fe-S cluster domain-containing protein [Bacteroidales bacterium]MDY3066618.1 Fe-S cluster domain-containing protein [Porphyromonas sp.]